MASATTALPGNRSSDRAPILVTGGTGFIGRHVVAQLLVDGHRIRLPYRTILPLPWRDDPRVEAIAIADLTTAELDPLVEGVAAIVHLAGLAHVGKADRAEATLDFTRVNDELTARLAAAARRVDGAGFIHLSSLATVTPNATQSLVNDLTNGAPTTAYGQSKLAAERHVNQLAGTGRFAVSLRPPLVVGAAARGNWASLQRLAATGLPLPFAMIDNRRNFISVQALAEAIALLCARSWPVSLSGTYAIADPEALSLPQVLTRLRAGMGLKPNLWPCPPQVFTALGAMTGRRRQLAGLTGSLQVDGSRFVATFGFAPSLSIGEAIRCSGAAFSTRPSRQSDTPVPAGPALRARAGRRNDVAKRLVDILLAFCAGIIALPFVVLAMAAIRLTSPGAALFRQVRVGRRERAFVCLKLRTMGQGTRNAPSHEVGAASVTAIGRVLRRTKFDELPQLWNVLCGDMSFVGPRPCLPSQTALIDARRARGLYALRPGITGVAQVAGVDMSDPQKLAALDATYLAQASLRGDFKLLVATVFGAGRGDRTAQQK